MVPHRHASPNQPSRHPAPTRGDHTPAHPKSHAQPHASKPHESKSHTAKPHAAKPHASGSHPAASRPAAHAPESKPHASPKGAPGAHRAGHPRPAHGAHASAEHARHPQKSHDAHASKSRGPHSSKTHETHAGHAPKPHARAPHGRAAESRDGHRPAAASHAHAPKGRAGQHAPAAPHAAPQEPAATTFAELGLAPPLLRALEHEGYTVPTPIQARAIPPIMLGRDVLGSAQTGTGKTAAYALPILHRLMVEPADPTHRGPALPRALVLCPTRELATQIAESFETYGRDSGLSGTVIYGGVSQANQVRALRRGVDILVATPGRLIDLMEQGLMAFSRTRILVLDEADRMLDMGFITPIRTIAAALPSPRQTLLFSATMPAEIRRLADALMRDPVRVAVAPVASTVELIEQRAFMVPRQRKGALLELLVNEGRIARAVVFTRTKHGADKVARRLNLAGITAVAIHGNKVQRQRERALEGFRTGRSRVLVATDVAARGLDVDGISHVFNFDVPNEPEAYVHRIGRTGRAGAAGVAISFCDGEERSFLRAIERLIARPIAVEPLPDLPPEPAHAAPDAAHHRGDAQGGSRGPAAFDSRHPRDAGPPRAKPRRPWTPKGEPRVRRPR